MKKLKLIIGFIFILLMLTACKKTNDQTNDQTNDPTTTPEVTATPTATPTPTPTETSNNAPEEPKTILTIADYFPFKEDAEYIYEGEGNEYASYVTYMDYRKDNSIQLRTDNGGTVVVDVLTYENGELTQVLSRPEAYYRENLIGKTEGEPEILLKEPLKKGTEWTIPGNHKRYISNTEVEITTPLGNYKALEVTTESDGDIVLDYYAPNVGLIKTVFKGNDYEVTSTLSKINEKTPLKQMIAVYYPTADEVLRVENRELTFHTNDITRVKLQEVAQKVTQENYRPLISTNTKINSLYLDKNKILNVDFSKELVSEMNAGAGYESLILQAITNTLGSYYGVDEVYITIDGKPYESGHILMKKGETFKVNFDKVKE